MRALLVTPEHIPPPYRWFLLIFTQQPHVHCFPKSLFSAGQFAPMPTVVFLRPLLLSLVLFGTILTGVALFTPSWRGDNGLISTNCGGGGCGPWWDNQPGWYQTVIILVILAFVVELVVLTWSALFWVGFCPAALNFPLGFLCAVSAALLVASTITFAAGNPNDIVGKASRGHLGYSYWLAVISAILMVSATLIACGVAGLLSKLTI